MKNNQKKKTQTNPKEVSSMNKDRGGLYFRWNINNLNDISELIKEIEKDDIDEILKLEVNDNFSVLELEYLTERNFILKYKINCYKLYFAFEVIDRIIELLKKRTIKNFMIKAGVGYEEAIDRLTIKGGE